MLRIVIGVIIASVLGIGGFLAWVTVTAQPGNNNMIFGASFDPYQAEFLGVDPKAAFAALLDDWGFHYVRLSAHWDDMEPRPGSFDFSGLDYFMKQAAERGARVTLAVGQKTPRWPECHVPAWAKELQGEDYAQARLAYIRAVVAHVAHDSALELWQVENEPFLALGWGDCPLLTLPQLQAEVALVKQADPAHRTLITDSGELSFWGKTGRAGDLFGTTLYRKVWNRWLGYWNYDWLPVGFYQWKARRIGRAPPTMFVAELQAEPWPPGTLLPQTPLPEQYRSMSLERFKSNVAYAQSTGFARSYLWGAEWWAWLQKQGVQDFAAYAKSLKKE